MFVLREADGSIPAGLDECSGHVGPVPGQDGEVYHYHAGDTFPNLPTCLKGLVARDNFVTTAAQSIGSSHSGRGPSNGRRQRARGQDH